MIRNSFLVQRKSCQLFLFSGALTTWDFQPILRESWTDNTREQSEHRFEAPPKVCEH